MTIFSVCSIAMIVLIFFRKGSLRLRTEKTSPKWWKNRTWGGWSNYRGYSLCKYNNLEMTIFRSELENEISVVLETGNWKPGFWNPGLKTLILSCLAKKQWLTEKFKTWLWLLSLVENQWVTITNYWENLKLNLRFEARFTGFNFQALTQIELENPKKAIFWFTMIFYFQVYYISL